LPIKLLLNEELMLPVIQDEIIDVTGKESRVIKIWREKNK
jgi:hypothetical protein